jgi:hypothetical protein
VLLVFGLWPYHEVLGWLPWGADATKWVFRGALDQDWWAWAAGSKHFVGYRPVTALSFTLNQALTGFAPWGFRITDLGLHLGSGALVFAVFRALTGDRSLLGLLPVVVVLLHPASEEIVPQVARRSYLLASVFGLGAVLCWVRGLREAQPSWPWLAVAAGLVLLALLSNELGYVIPPLLVLLALISGHRPRDIALALLPVAVVVGTAVAARYQVLGTLGGYSRRYFAYVRDGHPMWRELHSWQPGRIADAAWRYTLAPSGVTGRSALLPGGAGIVGVAVATSWLAWVGLAVPALRSEPGLRVRWVLVAWLVGGLAIIVGSQTWFWRQAYGLLPPLGMLIALGLADAWAGLRAGWGSPKGPGWGGHAVGAGVGAGLVASLLWNAPLPTMHMGDNAATRAGTPMVRTVSRLMERVRGPATVYLVLPVREPGAHMVRLWAARLAGRAGHGHEVALLGHLRNQARQGNAELTLSRPDQLLTLDRGLVFVDRGGRGVAREGDRTLALDRLKRGRRAVYVIAVDADDAWMVRVDDGAGVAEDHSE